MSKILKYFVASRILFLLFALIGARFISLDEGYLGRQFDPNAPYAAWIWANLDGRHFLEIATQGYQRFNFAYFPLYPTLISFFGYILRTSHLYIGLAISLVSFLAAMFVIYKIIKIDYKENTAHLALFFLSIFPFSFFYQTLYADSLFLLLSSLSFYFARKREWLGSGIFGGLTVLTRLSGISLVPALAVEWYLQNKGKVRNAKQILLRFLIQGAIAPALTGVGLLLFMGYLATNFGDPLLFQKAMIAWRQNEFVFPPQVIFRYIKIFLSVDKSLLVYWIAVLEFVSFFVYMVLSVYVWKKVRASYGVFMVVLLLLVTFTGTFAGSQRFMVHLFPGFLGMALLFGKNKALRYAAVALFLVLGFLLVTYFTRGYFVG